RLQPAQPVGCQITNGDTDAGRMGTINLGDVSDADQIGEEAGDVFHASMMLGEAPMHHDGKLAMSNHQITAQDGAGMHLQSAAAQRLSAPAIRVVACENAAHGLTWPAHRTGEQKPPWHHAHESLPPDHPHWIQPSSTALCATERTWHACGSCLSCSVAAFLADVGCRLCRLDCAAR